MRRHFITLILIAAWCLFPSLLLAKTPIVVQTHDNELVVTDPSKGENFYPRWAVFPPKGTDYRKVILSITYSCPDGKRCGEWDYIDNIFLTKTGGSSGIAQKFELARMISPYGWQFDSTWSFQWKADITEFGILLHDSCEITFRHSGYESNSDRGWNVSLSFEFTPGRPAVQVLAIDTLWNGSFSYGDSARPIDSLLGQFTLAHPKADHARLWLMQTGHGMDQTENCAEFCSKWRRLYLNDSLISQQQLWKECGENPVFPQAGTWIFDRANWCPGDDVAQSLHDISIKPGKSYTLRMQMQPYQAAQPTANWSITGYVFYCKKPWAQRDVMLEEIIIPSTDDRHARFNPQCNNLSLSIRNNGRLTVRQLKLGLFLRSTIKNQSTGESGPALIFSESVWNGSLAPGSRMELPLWLDRPPRDSSIVVITEVNGKDDDYEEDNAKLITGNSPLPDYLSPIIVQIRTNRAPTDNSVVITDAVGDTVHQISPNAGDTTKLFADTIHLSPGCYSARVADTAGDGLGFWFNADAGYGFVRLLDSAGRLLKGFTPDFGGSLFHSFSISEPNEQTSLPDSAVQVIVFPPRNFGTCDVDLFASWPTDMTIEVISDSGRTVFVQQLQGVRQQTMPLDITAQPDGVYFVKVHTPGELITRRIRVKRS